MGNAAPGGTSGDMHHTYEMSHAIIGALYYIQLSKKPDAINGRLSTRLPWTVGDALYGMPWHICPTVALHDSAVVVRSGRAGERWRIVARDRALTI